MSLNVFIDSQYNTNLLEYESSNHEMSFQGSQYMSYSKIKCVLALELLLYLPTMPRHILRVI